MDTNSVSDAIQEILLLADDSFSLIKNDSDLQAARLIDKASSHLLDDHANHQLIERILPGIMPI